MLKQPVLSIINSIRTGYVNSMTSVTVTGTFNVINLSTELLDLLAEGGWIRSWQAIPGERSAIIQLKYQDIGSSSYPCMKQMIVDNNKGTFVTLSSMYSNHYGLSTWVMSTSKGLMTDSQARAQGLGGVRIRYLF